MSARRLLPFLAFLAFLALLLGAGIAGAESSEPGVIRLTPICGFPIRLPRPLVFVVTAPQPTTSSPRREGAEPTEASQTGHVAHEKARAALVDAFARRDDVVRRGEEEARQLRYVDREHERLRHRLQRLANLEVPRRASGNQLPEERGTTDQEREDLALGAAPLPLSEGRGLSSRPELAGYGMLSDQIVRRVVARSLERLDACYRAQLLQQPNLEGYVRLELTIGVAGRVVGTSVLSTNCPQRVTVCLTRYLHTLRFPPPEGGNAMFEQIFLFQAIAEANERPQSGDVSSPPSKAR